MAVQASNIPDLVLFTLKQLGRLKFTDLMTNYRQTVALKRLMKKNKQTFNDGYEVQFNLLTGTGSTARHTGLGSVDQMGIPSNGLQGSVPWRHTTWNYSWDFREPLMNSGPSKIVDLIQTRRIQEFAGAIVLFEQTLWRLPALTDDVTPYGIPYYVVKSNTATSTNNGFNGAAPSGYTTVAGITPSYATNRYVNYATQYTLVSKDDFFRKARRMMKRIKFKNLTDEGEDYNLGDDYGLYVNEATASAVEEVLETQNENLGSDMDPMGGKATLQRLPLEEVDELDADTTNPLYAINWGVLHTQGLRGAWMKETMVATVAGQHTMSATHTDCSWNLTCTDRRRCGVIATDTTLPA
jgi:hypothetical protein